MTCADDSAVILGVYGKGNFGDEALLEVVAHELREVLPGVELHVFCSGPDAVQRRFGFSALTRTPAHGFWHKLGLVRRSRVLVVGGGTLLCDHGGGVADAVAVTTYFFWLVWARLFGVPTVLYGQGFGPARGRWVRLGLRLVRFVCTEVTVRDAGSYDLLTSVAGRRENFSLGADPVAAADRFLPATIRQRAGAAVAARIDSLRPYVVLAVRHPKLDSIEDSRAHLEGVGSAAAELCEHAGVNVVLFPTHLSDEFVDDRPVMDLLEPLLAARGIPDSRIIRASWDSLDDAALWLQSAEMVFGDRLHAMLVAALNRVTVAGVVVENKISGCLADVFQGEPLAGVVEPHRVATAGSHLQALWDRRASNDASYARLLAAYRARRDVNLRALQRALRSDNKTTSRDPRRNPAPRDRGTSRSNSTAR